MEIYQYDVGQMTKMAAMPLYGKNIFLNLLHWNQWADINKTWYVALGTQSRHSLGQMIACVDLDLFYGKRSNFY